MRRQFEKERRKPHRSCVHGLPYDICFEVHTQYFCSNFSFDLVATKQWKQYDLLAFSDVISHILRRCVDRHGFGALERLQWPIKRNEHSDGKNTILMENCFDCCAFIFRDSIFNFFFFVCKRCECECVCVGDSFYENSCMLDADIDMQASEWMSARYRVHARSIFRW